LIRGGLLVGRSGTAFSAATSLIAARLQQLPKYPKRLRVGPSAKDRGGVTLQNTTLFWLRCMCQTSPGYFSEREHCSCWNLAEMCRISTYCHYIPTSSRWSIALSLHSPYFNCAALSHVATNSHCQLASWAITPPPF
jgi:hypothetical protein